jgi:cytochrome c oxidase cbb3-type subunit 4
VAVTIYLLILVAAFMGIVIWVLGRKRKARFKANVRISLDAPAKALRPPKNMREEPP